MLVHIRATGDRLLLRVFVSTRHGKHAALVRKTEQPLTTSERDAEASRAEFISVVVAEGQVDKALLSRLLSQIFGELLVLRLTPANQSCIMHHAALAVGLSFQAMDEKGAFACIALLSELLVQECSQLDYEKLNLSLP